MFDPTVDHATYGVVGLSTPHDAGLTAVAAADASAPVRIRLHAQLPEGGAISSITLVAAPTFASALSFGRFAQVSAAVTEVARTEPMADYVTSMRASAPGEAFAAIERRANLVAAPATGEDAFSVIPLDSPLILTSSDALTPFSADMPLTVAPARTPTAASRRTYVWQTLSASFVVEVDWSNANNFWIVSPVQMGGDYNWAYPIAVLADAPGVEYTVGTSSDHAGVHIRSDLSSWLADLMSGTTYNEPWPEDGYADGYLAAYRYIVGRLPGQTPPKKGTIKEPEEIQVISYPSDATFSAGEFADVKDHLLLEIGHFVTADQWFGPNGIINAINTQISVLSAGDLTTAAAMMSIPPPTEVTMSLDDIFGLITTWVAEIPLLGSVMAAVIETGWTVAKNVIPVAAKQPIQATVASIADQLNNNLIYLVRSAQIQLATVASDWGRLSEFSSGVATGRISVGAFYGSGNPGSGSDSAPAAPSQRSADAGPPPLPPDYLTAAKNAWLTYCFQQLFTTQHKVHSQLSFADQAPANPWNPAAGTYQFTWSLPCSYRDSKNNVHANGYLVYDCSTDAPQQVLQQLFAPGSALNVNPMEFFGGFNGWPQVTPHYAGGYQNISNNIPFPPLSDRLGLDAWGQINR